jgi:adenylate kinase family enzyme
MTFVQRIVVVGVTGSGKTTLARQLAQGLNLPHFELDALHWEADWVEADEEIFRQRVRDSLAGRRWVVDGNYSSVRDLIWLEADTLVWLDYPLPFVLWRLVRRTWRRVRSQEELWNGNRDRLAHQFSRDSIFLWALTSYRKHQATYPLLFKQPEYAHLTVVCLRTPQATQAWLEQTLIELSP